MEETVKMADIDMAELDKFKLVLLRYISEELAGDIAGSREASWHTHVDWMSNDIALRLRQDILGETLGTLEIQHHASWLEMLKESAPRWVRMVWPVRYVTETYEARVLYPTLKLPDKPHNYMWIGPLIKDNGSPACEDG